MSSWETKWLRGVPVMSNPSVAMKFGNHDAGTVRRIQRSGKLKITCWQNIQVYGRGVQPVHRNEVEPRDTWEKAARNLRMGRRSRSCRGDIASLGPGIESTRLRLNSVVTVWFGKFGISQSGVSVRQNEPPIHALLRAVKLAWSGDVVQEKSAEGDPQTNCAAEISVNVVQGHVRSVRLAVESASGVEVGHDLLTWLAPNVASVHHRFAVGRDGKTAYERSVGRRSVLPLAQFSERV